MRRIIHIFKAEIRIIGTETMKRIHGEKTLCYLKKEQSLQTERVQSISEIKPMITTYISTFLYNVRVRRVAKIWD